MWMKQRATRFILQNKRITAGVARGADVPLVEVPNTPSCHVHGDDGFGDCH